MPSHSQVAQAVHRGFNSKDDIDLNESTYYYVLKYYKPISGNQIEKTGYLYLTY